MVLSLVFTVVFAIGFAGLYRYGTSQAFQQGFRDGVKMPEIVEAHLRAGSANAIIKSHWFIKLLAMELADWIGDAPNFITVQMTYKGIGYELTVRRWGGKTPAEVIGELREQLAENHSLNNGTSSTQTGEQQ